MAPFLKAFQGMSLELEVRFLTTAKINKALINVYVQYRDGDFFAVKEVSLLEQGSQAQECIQQLEGVRYTFFVL